MTETFREGDACARGERTSNASASSAAEAMDGAIQAIGDAACSVPVEELVPYGRLAYGSPGISATRLAEALDVPVGLVRRLVRPCGRMKIPYRREFDVYDPALAVSLRQHPEVLKAQERRRRRDPEAARRAAAMRRQKLVDELSRERPDLRWLYEELVDRMWNPATEASLRHPLYRELPAVLYDALAPYPEHELDAIEIVVNIVWAMTKERTWKVDPDTREQAEPLVWRVWRERLTVDDHPAIYRDVFAAAIRHLAEDQDGLMYTIPDKAGRRAWALSRLQEISSRIWPEWGVADWPAREASVRGHRVGYNGHKHASRMDARG